MRHRRRQTRGAKREDMVMTVAMTGRIGCARRDGDMARAIDGAEKGCLLLQEGRICIYGAEGEQSTKRVPMAGWRI